MSLDENLPEKDLLTEYCLRKNHSLCVKNIIQYAVTCQCLYIHKYLHFASQLFYVLPGVGDWIAMQETQIPVTSMKAGRNQRELLN